MSRNPALELRLAEPVSACLTAHIRVERPAARHVASSCAPEGSGGKVQDKRVQAANGQLGFIVRSNGMLCRRKMDVYGYKMRKPSQHRAA